MLCYLVLAVADLAVINAIMHYANFPTFVTHSSFYLKAFQLSTDYFNAVAWLKIPRGTQIYMSRNQTQSDSEVKASSVVHTSSQAVFLNNSPVNRYLDTLSAAVSFSPRIHRRYDSL